MSGFFPDVEIPPPFAHQVISTAKHLETDELYDASDPGTGKTRSCLDAIASRNAGKTLVLAPKSILVPSWQEDAKTFTPELRTVVANANNRAKAFNTDADVYITNNDAVSWLSKNPHVLKGFSTIIGDEFTAYKHRTSERSKALLKLMKNFQFRVGMSGTPNPNSVTELWHQILLLDGGERLGTNFWRFRASVCESIQTGPGSAMVKWVDKEGADEAIASLLDDMTIRHKFEECTDIPENTIRTVKFELSKKHRKLYDTLKNHAVLELKNGDLSAVNRAALTTKLLQAASGSIYSDDGDALSLADERYELVIELIKQRPQSVVAFNWKHQRDKLTKFATKAGITYGIIDGEVSQQDRTQVVKDFQAGKLQVVFAQPMSASHGLTLTRGTATIWTSPIYDAERFKQFNHRIYRTGQTQRTETILISASDTIEQRVYDILIGKVSKMVGLLDLIELNFKENMAA